MNRTANELKLSIALLPPSAILLTAIVAASIAVFFVPWFFPRTEPVAGESYSLGFNNRLAVIGLGLVILGIAALRILNAKSNAEAQATLRWFSPDSSRDLWSASKVEYAIVGLFCLFMTQLILWWDSVLVIPYWGEADYFLNRIDLIALGYRPYLDFHHNYGPLMLYGPLLLDWATEGSLGIESAYAWTVAGWTVLGAAGVFLFLRLLSIPSPFRPWVLAMSLLMWVPLTMGLNYTPLRFIAVPLSITAVHVLVSGLRTCEVLRVRSIAGLFLVSAALTALTFAVSPEMGVAAAAALIGYSFVTGIRGDFTLAASITIGVCISCLVMHWGFQGYLYGIRAFSAGANNFPVLPNLHNLLLVISSSLLISKLSAAVVIDHRHPNSPLAASISIASMVMLFPSMGRCDPGHVIFNSLMIFLLWFPASASVSPRMHALWCGFFAIAMVILSQASYWNHYIGPIRNAFAISQFYQDNPATIQEWKNAWSMRKGTSPRAHKLNWRRTAPFPAWLEHPDLLSTRLTAPLFADFGMDRFLKLQPKYEVPYHPCPKPEILNPASVLRAVEDARRHDVVLMPEAYADSGGDESTIDKKQYETQINDFLSGLMLFPSRCAMHTPPYIPEIEVARRLMKTGTVIGRGSGFVLLKPLKEGYAE